MAKSQNQKLKLLYIVKILNEYTDEDNPISMKELIDKLSEYEIGAERKSIYDDMLRLKDFGFDIEFDTSHTGGGYYLASRDFEIPELKILIDMVQSSRFLTEKKSRELIKKLEGLGNKQKAKELQRTVFVSNRVKSENETVFYLVDKLNRGIINNKSVTFLYYDYTPSKDIVYRKNGEKYCVSPYYLIFSNENYYLIGYDEKSQSVRHYRVDRMKKIEITADDRLGQAHFRDFDVASYQESTFGMFGGSAVDVRLYCDNSLIGVVIDRFGKEIRIDKEDEEHFIAKAKVVPSGQFYGWLAGLGVRAKLIYPESVVDEYKKYILAINDFYNS